MIETFIRIQNVGRFRDCKPKGDVSFRKLTLVFAENGRGKTTLCAILPSLQSGHAAFISERKTLGTSGIQTAYDFCCLVSHVGACCFRNDNVLKTVTPVGWQKTSPQARKGMWFFSFYEENCIAN